MIRWKSIEFLEEYNEELLTENLMLHLKIEKAIEYIKVSINKPQPFYEYLYGDENGEVQNLDKLLEILGDKENE